jgi:hypothetical protein
MCPRFAVARVQPGDLVWCMIDGGVNLYYDSEAGANQQAKEAAGFAEHMVPCLCLAVDDTTMMVLSPTRGYGWTHRLFWERAGVDEQEWETGDVKMTAKRLYDIGRTA